MAADTAAKRYSAMNISSPWRGLNVVPDVTIPQGERQAVMFYYSGILFQPFVPPTSFQYRTVGKTIIRIGGY